METYPEILLPKANYKYINCNISPYYLIRHIDLREDIPLINELEQIDAEYICHPKGNIRDLSTSLLSHFLTEHTKIALTEQGVIDFAQECEPNFAGVPLVNPTHFYLKETRQYWLIQYSLINNIMVPIDHDGKTMQAKSYVLHSPMRWNFWHFSVRWTLDGEDLHSTTKYSPSQLKTFHNKIGAKVRSVIAQNADTNIDVFPIIENDCFIV